MTSTITTVGPGAPTETDTTFDFYTIVGTSEAPPCEMPAGCDEVAKYACTLRCCGQLVLICETHFDGILERIKAWLDNGLAVQCGWCGNKVPDGKPFTNVERI